MPADERMFDEEPLPSAVVLDTSFVVNVLHENEDHHLACRRFAERLIDADVVAVYSPLLRLEFWHGWARAVRMRGIPRDLLDQPALIADPGLERARAYAVGDRYLRDLLGLFRRYEIRIGVRLLDRALGLMGRYNLTSHDACVVAIAFHAHVPDVVSLDKKFRRVDGIHLWNDRISQQFWGPRTELHPTSSCAVPAPPLLDISGVLPYTPLCALTWPGGRFFPLRMEHLGGTRGGIRG